MREVMYLSFVKKRFKCLPLEGWMKSKFAMDKTVDAASDIYPPFVPHFNRPGVYFDRYTRLSWFESEDGRAFEIPIQDFMNSLSLLNAGEMTIEQENALRAIVNVKLATPIQRTMLGRRDMWNGIRQMSLAGRKMRLRVKSKLQQLRKQQ